MAATDMWTDLVEPVELTGYARAFLEDYERQQNGSLVDYLPNEFLNDIVAKFEVGATGLQPIADYIAYDTESPLGSLPGGQTVMFELPKLGRKMSISEYDEIRSHGNTSGVTLRPTVDRITKSLVTAISNRLEYERGYAIENAALLIDDETGFKQSGDWGRAAEHEVSADTGAGEFWNDDDADPIENLISWKDQYIATNGFGPGSILTSTSVLLTLQRHPSLRVLFSSLAGAPGIITIPAVNETLQAYGIPPFRIYDRQVNFKGTVQKVLSPEYLFMLPTPGGTIDGVKLGATYWGTTLESYRPEYGIDGEDRPGIVVGAWETRDPISKWVHAAAIGLAVMGDANLSLRAQVLPESS